MEEIALEEMVAEEERVGEVNKSEEDHMKKELEKKLQEERELVEQRHKRLMHLLSKSQFYSQFLLQKIETQREEEVKKSKRGRKTTKLQEEETEKDENDAPNSNIAKKRKYNDKEDRKRQEKYLIADVLDEKTIKETAGKTESEEHNREEQPDLFEGGCMRPYQLDGFTWLKVMFENGVNGILADEMGLGKTIQCIGIICHLVKKGVPGPFLVVAPLSTLPNWVSEFKRFAPKVVIRDQSHLAKQRWRYLVVDEGHRIKNFECRLIRSLRTLPTTNRLLLTGTPLQNNLSELWSLLNFLLPEIFDNLSVFESWFNIANMMEDDADSKILQQEQERQIITTLHKILNPFLLRRTKIDVDVEIPPKKELLVYTPLTPLQLRLYEATISRDFSMFEEIGKEQEEVQYGTNGRPVRKSRKHLDYSAILDESESQASLDRYIKAIVSRQETKEVISEKKKTSVTSIKLQNIVMQCRKIVNHPYLVEYPLTDDGEYKIDKEIIELSGKLKVLDQLLKELKKRDHKVLIFSQMTKMLDILEDYLTLQPKFKYRRFDGRMDLDSRREAIEMFNTDPEQFICLLSTRAGGLGINLTSADTVILFDSDWNPQQDLQAQDRCHRIGQSKPVLILRLIAASTIDEYIIERAATKRKLEKIIMQNGKFKSSRLEDRPVSSALDIQELQELLNQRDHIKFNNSLNGNVFSKEELNRLLDRSDCHKWSNMNGNSSNEMNGVFKVINQNILH
ncbi:lymphoid-specific helicase-like isoform X2 [Oratosquilla oratoria]|uniref:lymphoid-specific helicase-like isoform X2 n=1 Tax=Oratosquilla oratoria TaxID=337810 RepID=UPI003F771D63